jgi:hypothetical protein
VRAPTLALRLHAAAPLPRCCPGSGPRDACREPFSGHPRLTCCFGATRAVTGATDGIGKGVAMQLAKRGVSVVLVSRTQARLDDTATEIKAACPSVDTLSVQFDFSSATDADYVRALRAGDVMPRTFWSDHWKMFRRGSRQHSLERTLVSS